jgi:NAD(P)-dependent dehydrogenase (short-subunit alcohol dehydrogenase family)
MKEFMNRIAVVSGGGAGMGRELVRQLLAEGCHVAACDISSTAIAETKRLAEASPKPQGTRLTIHTADISDEVQVQRWRQEIADQHATTKIHLLFNNAGIGGGGSFVTGERAAWEKTFNICWNGVYLCTRAFMPMLVAAEAGHIVNTSSVNGFWASIGPGMPHSAYCAAKFAVKGFTEALITDLRVTAPHIKCSVVMPGHIGTSIAANSRRLHGSGPLDGGETDTLTPTQVAQARFRLAAVRPDAAQMSDADILALTRERERRFLEEAPTTAAQAATIILDGVKAERWRILVGHDAERIDALVRQTPEQAYEADFFKSFATEVGWQLGGSPTPQTRSQTGTKS